MTKKLVDEVNKGVADTKNFLDYMLRERSQLQGTIVYLMQLMEKEKIVMPPIEAFKEYQTSFYITYDHDEENVFCLKLVSVEELNDGEESD